MPRTDNRSARPLPMVRWALLAPLLLIAAACGDDETTDGVASETASATETTSASETTDDETMTTEATDDVPERIVSLSPTATEMLFAIGAGDQVIAVDSFSNYPPEAPTTELSAFEPSLEAIAAQDPDLVVFAFDSGELGSGLDALGVATLFQPAAVTLDDVYAQIADLGVLTGHVDEAAALNADLRRQIDEIVASVPAGGDPIRVYHELDDTFYSASSNTFIGEMYNLFGVVNLADEADADGFGYPQLNAEYLLEADPQVIVITTEIGYGPDEVAARPGWDSMSAVANGNIVVIDGDIASRWGPRIPEFLRAVAAALASESVGS